ncbi:thrombin inhibitor hemalin-like [Haliotis asinina]|uniref:thrombin inhibitor hemalin-like n=1 Tax=Haliotis asinina TaxID=109174 RepID=UPI00353201CD
MTRFYFDNKKGVYRRFGYGGCQGNSNNFNILHEYQAICGEQRNLKSIIATKAPHKISVGIFNATSELDILLFSVDQCKQRPDPGHCFASILRFFYDQFRGTCRPFIYGGCGGNYNNFLTKQQCQFQCNCLPLIPNSLG